MMRKKVNVESRVKGGKILARSFAATSTTDFRLFFANQKKLWTAIASSSLVAAFVVW